MEFMVCKDKIRDKGGVIIGYVLQDLRGNNIRIKADELKTLIILRKIKCLNLKIAADHRLIDRAYSEARICNEGNIKAVVTKIRMLHKAGIEFIYRNALYISEENGIILKEVFIGSGIFEIPEFVTGFFGTRTQENKVFKECRNIKLFNKSSASDFNSLFYDCMHLENADLSSCDFSNVTDMGSLFDMCMGLKTVKINGSTLQNVKTMERAFNNCFDLSIVDFGNTDISSLENTSDMFYSCMSLLEVKANIVRAGRKPILSERMFKCCVKLGVINIDVPNGLKLKNLQSMFSDCTSLSYIDLSKVDTSDNKYLLHTFTNCIAIEKIELGKMTASKVEIMSEAFSNCKRLRKLDLSYFDTKDGVNMTKMFDKCSKLVVKVTKKFMKDKNITYEMYRRGRVKFIDIEEKE